MKKIYFAVLLNSILFCTVAQTYSWAKRGGLWSYDYGNGVATDHAGNVYVAGKYEYQANFDGNILPCNQCNHDIFVARYTQSGTIDWIHTGGGPLGDYAHCLACDGNYVYVGGEIEGWGDQITFPGSSIALTAIGDNDVFLAKYDLSGNLLWALNDGWWHTEKFQGVTADKSGNIYACGYFKDTTIIGGTMRPGRGGSDMLLAKYDASGNLQWAKTAGSRLRDEAKSVACDTAGNVYVCGMYHDSAYFGGQMVSAPNGYMDMFVAKYSPSGNLLWVQTAGGNYDEVGWGVTVDNAGMVYVTGEFNASAMFGSTQLITHGNADVFVACYDQNGNLQWANGSGGPLIDRARGIGCDGYNVVITGQFGNSATFGSYALNAADSSDIFFASIDNAGNYIGAMSATGIADSLETLGYESGNAIAADGFGNVYGTGSSLNGATFGSTTLNQYGHTDFFLTRISQLTGIRQVSDKPQVFSIYPNPANGHVNITCNRSIDGEAEIMLLNSMGEQIVKRKISSNETQRFDLSWLSSGIYVLEIAQANGENTRHKLIVSR